MNCFSKHIKNSAAVLTAALFFSCTNNFNAVKKIGNSENKPIGEAETINLKYTDSGRVTSNLISPKMLDYSNRTFPYREFPEGILLYLYDKQNNKSTIISNYAISYEKTGLIDLQGNVKIATHKKDTLFAEQLYYDQKKSWVFTNLPVTFRQGRDIINGRGFDSDSKFKTAQVLEIDGIITMNE